MNIDSLKALLTDLDPAALLPELEPLTGKLQSIAHFVVVIGPILLLALGLIYLLLSPKEANHRFGYRCLFGMGSVEAWRFSQKLAGLVHAGLGLILLIIMLLIRRGFAAMELQDMILRAGKCLLWQAGLVLFFWFATNLTVAILFDYKGNLRRDKKQQKKEKDPA